jgi:hypothetical protein
LTRRQLEAGLTFKFDFLTGTHPGFGHEPPTATNWFPKTCPFRATRATKMETSDVSLIRGRKREAGVPMIDREGALAPGSATGLSPLGVDLPLAPSGDPSWLLVEEGFTLVREHEIESIFAVANGYIGTRASLEEGSRLSQPVTFAAGIYADDPASGLGPALAVLPDWPHLEIMVDDDRLAMESGRVIEHRRMLDLRQGVLWREWRQQDASGRVTRVRFLRLASLADRHVLLQSVAVTAENYAGRVELIAGLTLPDGRGERGQLTVTRDLATVIALARETSVAMATGSVAHPKSEATKSRQERPTDHVDERWSWEAGLGETVYLNRMVSVYTSRDVADTADTARAHVAMIQKRGVSAFARDHVAAGAVGGTPRRYRSLAMTRPSGRCASPCIIWWRPQILTMSTFRSALVALPAKTIVGTSSGTPKFTCCRSIC